MSRCRMKKTRRINILTSEYEEVSVKKSKENSEELQEGNIDVLSVQFELALDFRCFRLCCTYKYCTTAPGKLVRNHTTTTDLRNYNMFPAPT